jgi:EAL domain-containing protein (putative c-di-GMP-specific phosphodiesterase class I)
MLPASPLEQCIPFRHCAAETVLQARYLRISVIAEGIAGRQQWEKLRELLNRSAHSLS